MSLRWMLTVPSLMLILALPVPSLADPSQSEREKARQERTKEREKAQLEWEKERQKAELERLKHEQELEKERQKAELERLKHRQELEKERQKAALERAKARQDRLSSRDDDDDEIDDDDDEDDDRLSRASEASREAGGDRRDARSRGIRDNDRIETIRGRAVPRDGRRDFDALDRDGNNVISRREWPQSAGSFGAYDQNRDGVISRGELRGRPLSGRR
jgi:hypothetical protein